MQNDVGCFVFVLGGFLFDELRPPCISLSL